jgi:hypothetical protein
MDGKIAVEEHFVIPETTPPGAARWPTPYWAEMHAKLIDLFDRRLAEMDQTGIELAVLSLNADGIQAIPDAAKAVATARQANDVLAEAVSKRPNRFAGLAALPCRTRKRQPRSCSVACAISNSKARWSTAFRKSVQPTASSITICRSTVRSGRKLSGLACRSICIHAIRRLCTARL